VDRVIAGNDEDIKSVFKWYFSEAVSTKGWPPPDVFYLWYYVCTMDVDVQVDVEVLVEKMGISVRRWQPKVGRLLMYSICGITCVQWMLKYKLMLKF